MPIDVKEDLNKNGTQGPVLSVLEGVEAMTCQVKNWLALSEYFIFLRSLSQQQRASLLALIMQLQLFVPALVDFVTLTTWSLAKLPERRITRLAADWENIEESHAKIGPVADSISLAQCRGQATQILWMTDFKLSQAELVPER